MDDVRQGKEGRLGERGLDVGGVDAVLLGHGEAEEGMGALFFGGPIGLA